MDDWRYRSRDGSLMGWVAAQLASGRLWTFFLNCLWTMFNTIVTILECLPHVTKEELSQIVIVAAGDDCILSLPNGLVMPNGNYLNSFHVTMKLKSRRGSVAFCHHVFTRYGVFPDPVRLLAKFLSKPLEPTIKCMSELKNALNALCQKYRDSDRLLELEHAIGLAYPEKKSACIPSMNMILRICNTPEKRLLEMLVEQRVTFIYREVYMEF